MELLRFWHYQDRVQKLIVIVLVLVFAGAHFGLKWNSTGSGSEPVVAAISAHTEVALPEIVAFSDCCSESRVERPDEPGECLADCAIALDHGKLPTGGAGSSPEAIVLPPIARLARYRVHRPPIAA